MLTIEQDTARRAYIHFQHALYELEQSMKPLTISIECQFELDCIGKISRSFFKMANQELFSQQKVSVLNGK